MRQLRSLTTGLLVGLVLASPSSLTRAQVILNVPAQFASIQGAIAAANNGDTVLVAPGIYPENIDFTGKSITVRSSQGAAATRIAGGPLGPSCCRTLVSFHSGEGPTSILDGFLVSGNGGPLQEEGVGCLGSSPSIRNCIIDSNGSENSYGIVGSQSSPTVTNCQIVGNWSLPYGYGVQLTGGSARFSGCVISGNGGDVGSGMSISGSHEIEDCTIENNSADFDAGGILCDGPTVIRRCRIRNNASVGVRVSSALIEDCEVTGNQSSALLFNVGARGIDVIGSATIRNCTIVDNNTSTLSPGGGGLIAGTATVSNSILWNNAPNQIVGAVSVSFSDVQGGFAGAGNLNADPLFVNSAGGDFHLSWPSSCRESGSVALAALPARDIDGEPRLLYPSVDVGADEWLPPRNVTLTLDQPSGPGSVRIRNSGGTPGALYVFLFTLEPANAGAGFGAGQWGGLHMPLSEILFEFSLGQPPILGNLDTTGGSLSVVPLPPGILTNLTGYAITHLFAPPAMIGASLPIMHTFL